jgi:quercetin dioxygenase-like cupin family protein
MTRHFSVVMLALGISAALSAQSSTVRSLVDKDHRRAQPEAANDFARGNTINVVGDPSKPGMYVIRRLFKPGETSSPHYHDQDRYVTVIKGTWYTGEGDVKDPAKMVGIKAGGFMLHPAGLHHYDGSNDSGEVIVQIIGMGPVSSVSVDAQGKPTSTR